MKYLLVKLVKHMKNKVKFLIKNTFLKKVKTKWFIVVNAIFILLITGLINLNSIIAYFGGDFDKTNNIYVVSDENTYNLFKTYYSYVSSTTSDLTNYEVKALDKNLNEAKEELKDTKNIIIVINYENKEFTSELISYNSVNSLSYQVIYNSLSAVQKDSIIGDLNISAKDKLNLSSNLNIENTYLNESNEDSKTKEILSGVLIPIVIVPFFMLIVMLIQFIGADINEEKSTRGMEIIISSIPPESHFFSKIIGTALFVLLQGTLFLTYTGVGLLIKKLFNGATSSIDTTFNSIIDILKGFGVIDNLVPFIILFIILALISFLAYGLFAGIMASMTTSVEDYQQLQGPIMIICVIGYYLAIMASIFEGSLLIKAVSFIPFISVMLSPILFLLGQTTLIDLGIAIIIMVGAVYLLIKYGLRVYKIGILNYSSKDLWKKVFKGIKEKGI